MNNRTSFALLALLTAVSTLAISSAHAEHSKDGEQMRDLSDLPQACVECSMEDARAAAHQMLLDDTPISVWTEKTDFGHNEMIRLHGQVANTASGFPVTLTVVNPLLSIVTIDQINVNDDGSFETTINTAGTMWKYDGTYTIKANYGSAEKTSSVLVELTGGVEPDLIFATPDENQLCGDDEISVRDQCIPYSITGGTVTGATLNPGEPGSILIRIDAIEDGTLTVTPSATTMEGIFLLLVDDEQCDEPECEIVGNKVTVMFPAGAETIEIFGAYVIPEFGTIAAMILAVAIISIIAISAKSRLSIIPRY